MLPLFRAVVKFCSTNRLFRKKRLGLTRYIAFAIWLVIPFQVLEK